MRSPRRLAPSRIAVALAAVLAALSAPASAVAGDGHAHGVTFAGQCQFSGVSTFSQSVTLIPAPVVNRVSATGTCTGTVTGPGGATTTLNNAPVAYRAVEFGPMESCGSDLNATGVGELVFPQGRLRFRVLENRTGGQAVLAYTGRTGGTAAGVAYVSGSDPVGLLQQCESTGITSAPVQIVFTTTPAISG